MMYNKAFTHSLIIATLSLSGVLLAACGSEAPSLSDTSTAAATNPPVASVTATPSASASASITPALFFENFENQSIGTYSANNGNFSIQNSTSGFTAEITNDGSKILKLTASTQSRTVHIPNSTSLGTHDYAISGRVKPSSIAGRAGVLVRWADKNNYYCAYFKGTQLILEGKNDSETILIGHAVDLTEVFPDFNGARYHTVKLAVSGSDPVYLTAYIDGVKIIDNVRPSYTIATGQFGFYGSMSPIGDSLSMDDLTVTAK